MHTNCIIGTLWRLFCVYDLDIFVRRKLVSNARLMSRKTLMMTRTLFMSPFHVDNTKFNDIQHAWRSLKRDRVNINTFCVSIYSTRFPCIGNFINWTKISFIVFSILILLITTKNILRCRSCLCCICFLDWLWFSKDILR